MEVGKGEREKEGYEKDLRYGRGTGEREKEGYK